MNVALRVADVSKQYRIYASPGDRLKELLTRGRLKRHQEFWALKDISFEIEKGTTTGIIGPNGSGKSTLLQIITGTLEPTHGSVYYDGRIAALLELGAGFNPDFTGIENIFMNASLMGFSRSQTEALLPEIERFAEIGDFIHQAVKTYSSGMYVRVAFAIAASIEPDILLVDEALAVGDSVFQHRCLRRIAELQERGTTVLFVSHELAAVRALCARAILLNHGSITADGAPSDVLNCYQKIIMERERAYDAETERPIDGELAKLEVFASPFFTYRHGNHDAEIVTVELEDTTHRRVEIVETGAALTVRLVARFNRDIDNPVIGFLVRNRHGMSAFGTNTNEQQIRFGTVRRGEALEVTFAFNCWLGVDEYSISAAIHSLDGESYDWMDGVFFFRVTSATLTEGIANLNATATVRRIEQCETKTDETRAFEATTTGVAAASM